MPNQRQNPFTRLREWRLMKLIAQNRVTLEVGLYVVLMLVAVLLGSPLFAQNVPPGVSEGSLKIAFRGRVDDLDAWVTGYVEASLAQAGIPGAVVVIADREGIVLQRGFGLADIASETLVSAEQTLFRPGSISKLFTATAVMQLVERGQLDLDADIRTYLDFDIPDFEGGPITLRHLLTHTPGFEEAIRDLFAYYPVALEDYVKAALPERVFAAGTTPAYSNYGSALAGYIVERTSGMAFADYVQQHIFAPLEMAHSSFEQPLPEHLAPLMSRGYRSLSEPPRDFEVIAAAPAGGLSASGADIGRFMVAHLNAGQGLLARETAAAMHTYQAPGLLGLNTMALGFYEKWTFGHRGIGHGGDTTLFHSDLTLFPEQGVGIFIALNSGGDGGLSFAIRQRLLEEFVARYLPQIAPAPVLGVSEAEAEAHAKMVSGAYSASRSSFTNFMRLLALFTETKITTNAEGSLAYPGMEGFGLGPFDWVEVAPFVWQNRHSSQRVAAQVVDGRVVRLGNSLFSPFTVLTPVPTWQSAAIWGPMLLVALAIVALQAVLWPGRYLVRRRYGATLAGTQGEKLSYRAKAVLSWAVIACALGWLAVLAAASADVRVLSGGVDWLLRTLLLASPVAATGLLLSSAAHLALARGSNRRWIGHVVRFASILAAFVLVWVVFGYNLYGLELRF